MTSINNDDNVNTDNNTVKTDILIPVYLDKTPILWDGNRRPNQLPSLLLYQSFRFRRLLLQ